MSDISVESSPASPDTPQSDREETMAVAKPTSTSLARSMFHRRNEASWKKRTPGRSALPPCNKDKVRKRRRQVGDRDVSSPRSREPDSDSDFVDHAVQRSLFQKLQKNPDAPYVLNSWLTLATNTFLVGLAIAIIWIVISTLRRDMMLANEKARIQHLDDIRRCTNLYVVNKCSDRTPLNEDQCNEWENCMQQSADAIDFTRVVVRRFVALFNEVVDLLSLKSWLALVCGSLVGSVSLVILSYSRRPTVVLRRRPVMKQD